MNPTHIEQKLLKYSKREMEVLYKKSEELSERFCTFCLDTFAKQPDFYKKHPEDFQLVCAKWLLDEARKVLATEEMLAQWVLQRSLNIIQIMQQHAEKEKGKIDGQ